MNLNTTPMWSNAAERWKLRYFESFTSNTTGDSLHVKEDDEPSDDNYVALVDEDDEIVDICYYVEE